jgi:hypothetical protein
MLRFQVSLYFHFSRREYQTAALDKKNKIALYDRPIVKFITQIKITSRKLYEKGCKVKSLRRTKFCNRVTYVTVAEKHMSVCKYLASNNGEF